MSAKPAFATVGLAFCGWVLMLAGTGKLQARAPAARRRGAFAPSRALRAHQR